MKTSFKVGSTARLFERYSFPDARDRNYLITARQPKTARRKRKWRCLWRNADQGSTPHCCGFAGVRLLDADPFNQFIDPNGLYTIAQHFDEWEGEDYDGTSIRAVMKVLKMLGFFKEYRWVRSVDAMIPTMLNDGPILLGLPWTQDMCYPNPTTGLIKPTGASVGGHAILADEVDTVKELVWLNNTWGVGWGKAGRCCISFEDLDELFSLDGEGSIGIETVPSWRT
jgi:hypothetical protein